MTDIIRHAPVPIPGRDRCAECYQPLGATIHEDHPGVYRTKTGRVLTDADLDALADEAEAGYDVIPDE